MLEFFDFLGALKIMIGIVGAGFLFGLGARLTLHLWPSPTNIKIVVERGE